MRVWVYRHGRDTQFGPSNNWQTRNHYFYYVRLGCAGMVVLHPDLLLSGTRVTGSFRCQRQSVLEERFAGSSNDKAVEGTLMHEVFQVSFCYVLH